MGEDRLDKFIKKQVFDHQTPSDPDALWNKIQAKQAGEEEPKRKIFWLWYALGAALLIGLGTSIWMWSGNAQDQLVNNTTEIKEAISSTNNSADNSTSSASDNLIENSSIKTASDIAAQNTETTDATVSVEKNDAPISTTNRLNNRTSKTDNIEQGITEGNTNILNYSNNVNSTTNTSNKTSFLTNDRNPITTISEPQNAERNIDAIAKVIPPAVAQDDASNVFRNPVSGLTNQEKDAEEVVVPRVDAYTDESIETSSEEATIVEDAISKNDTEYEVAEAEGSKEEVSEPEATVTTENGDENEGNVMGNSDEDEDENENEDDKEKDEEEKNPKIIKENPFSIGLYYNYGKASRSLSAILPADNAYANLRENSETPLDASRLGIDVRYKLKSNIYAKIGAEFAQFNERFDYAKTEVDDNNMVENFPVRITYGLDSMPVTTYGPATQTVIYNSSRKIFNHYKTIDVPLMIGYEKSGGNKFGFFAEMGLGLNLMFSQSGQIMNAQEQDLENRFTILEDQTDLYNSTTGLSLLGGFGAVYNVTDKLSLSLSPAFKYQLASIASDNSKVDQKYFFYSGQLGLRFKL